MLGGARTWLIIFSTPRHIPVTTWSAEDFTFLREVLTGTSMLPSARATCSTPRPSPSAPRAVCTALLEAGARAALWVGFGRIVALYCRSSALYQIYRGIRCLCF